MTSSDQPEPDLGEQPGTPPLARTALDRAAEHRKDDVWLADAWKRGLVLVIDLAQGGRALVTDRPDGRAALVLVPSAEAPEAEHSFLGLDPDGGDGR